MVVTQPQKQSVRWGVSEMASKGFPEIHDLASITIKQIEYYGYVDEIDFDMRDPRICLEFHPGCRVWYDFAEVRLVNYPEYKKP